MDDTVFTIAFAKGYALGVLIKLKTEIKSREGDDLTAFHFYEIIDKYMKGLKEGKDEI